ncbi:MAG: VOC family protein [Chloroflexota bacterium]
MMNKIYPCLWFDGNAKEAAEFYCSVFPNSKILNETPVVVNFELNGAKFMGLNGGPEFKFTEAVSFVINCGTQEEIDSYWDKLTADGGQEIECGWLRDKYGLCWQVVPTALEELMADPVKGQNVMNALLKMKKLDIEKLKQAYDM